MRTLEQLQDRLAAYGAAEYIYLEGMGYIAWHYSTGDNLEVVFIEVAEKRKGYGKGLYRAMVNNVLRSGRVPYNTVFSYHLGRNTDAENFYKAFGWQQINLDRSIYVGDDTVMVWITWADLKKKFGL